MNVLGQLTSYMELPGRMLKDYTVLHKERVSVGKGINEVKRSCISYF